MLKDGIVKETFYKILATKQGGSHIDGSQLDLISLTI